MFRSPTPIIRPLTLLDVARYSLFRDTGRVNRAYTISSFQASNPDGLSLVGVWRKNLALRDKGYAWALRDGNCLFGLVSARERSGYRSWEVSHLYVRPGKEALTSDLLETISQEAGLCGAERVFLRLRRSDPLADIARRSGFFPRIPEVLYSGAPQNEIPVPRTVSSDASPMLRATKPHDEHGLFRLYNAATPSEIRYSVGMTLEQWAASREHGHACKEYVLDAGERLGASLRLMRKSKKGQMLIMIHPEFEERLPSVVDFGLENLGKAQTVCCLVPEYQVALQRVLAEKGFDPVSDYITLVKSLVIRARQKSRVRATAASV